MTRLVSLISSLALCALIFITPAATASQLVAQVDVSSQTMTVIRNGKVAYRWPVSTARKGKWTPRGSFRGQSLSRHHRSSLYNNAPMPYSIFFRGNYAIHGTNHIKRLGRPASAGCVRLHPDHAAVLFSLTRKIGVGNLKVVIKN